MNEYNMNEEQNMPDEVWRRAFDGADETPPPRVWNAIERQLDEPGSGRIVPLWGRGLSRPVVWRTGLAAAVALLVVGFWLVRTEPAAQPAVARVQPAEAIPSVLTQPEGAGAPNDAVANLASAPEAKSATTDLVAASQLKTTPTALGLTADRSFETQRGDVIPYGAAPQLAIPLPNALAAPLTNSVATLLTSKVPGSSSPKPNGFAFAGPTQLAGRGIRLYDTRPLQRMVWFGTAETDQVTQPVEEATRVAAKRKWASVSVMPGVFNPGVSVAIPAYALTNAPKAGNGSVVNSRGSVAVSVQATAGVQLTDRWSLESGVGYLVGRSTVESPGAQPVYNFAQSGYVASTAFAATAAPDNLYTDILRSQRNTTAVRNTSTAVSNDLLISNTNRFTNLSSYGNRQTVSNDYTYVQVPVQVGYELRPRKRLTLALLGGIITNIFVKNTVDDALVVKPSDGIYEPVALVASMGARFRYRSSERWSASVAGVYQPAITPGTRPDSPVQTQPTTAGVTVGVDYHF